MNIAVLSGYLGNDPDTTYTKDGLSISKFSIAFSMAKDQTGWVECVCFDKLAEMSGNWLQKGDKILIQGRLQYEQWQDKNGNNRNALKLIASNIEFITIKKNKDDKQNARKTNNQNARKSNQNTVFAGQQNQPDIPDDIPF